MVGATDVVSDRRDKCNRRYHFSCISCIVPISLFYDNLVALIMRPLILLWSCAAFAVSAAAAKDGYLWTIDQSIVSSATAQINSDLASSIVARRRGQTDSRSLRTADDLTLQEINTYGGWQQPLFGERAGEAPGKLFIRISGFDGGKGFAILIKERS